MIGAKIRAVREALKQETAKRRAAELQHMADELRAKAEDPTTPPAQQAGFTTMAAQHDQQAAEIDDDDPPPPSADSDLPRNTPPAKPDGTPQPKAQRNFTDPESRIMLRDGGFLQAYNAQIAVDEGAQIIVAAALSNQAPDAEYFEPMLRRVVDNCDAVPTCVTFSSRMTAAHLPGGTHRIPPLEPTVKCNNPSGTDRYFRGARDTISLLEGECMALIGSGSRIIASWQSLPRGGCGRQPPEWRRVPSGSSVTHIAHSWKQSTNPDFLRVALLSLLTELTTSTYLCFEGCLWSSAQEESCYADRAHLSGGLHRGDPERRPHHHGSLDVGHRVHRACGAWHA